MHKLPAWTAFLALGVALGLALSLVISPGACFIVSALLTVATWALFMLNRVDFKDE